ncbi:MAG: DUF357 domain-containing protein [Candidatus Thorarchaeota archaeon]|jgi:hypothetical protein
MEAKITEKKLKQYLELTNKALNLAKKNINPKKKQEAKEILAMAEAYLSDSKHFKKQGNLVNSFAAVNYAHGWLDSGARLGVFKVKDTQLFTIE